ncbi:MAG: penicillin acylase family protein [Cyclobacteriaceae bacterium]
MKKNLVRLPAAIIFLIQCLSINAQFSPDQIEIMRDDYGVPHIYAPTDAQVSYGLAWAHAEDDFKTIQETMMAAKQLMGRYLGKDGAPIDYVVGLMRCEDIVEEHFDEVDPAFLKIVEGYAAGLNAYAKHHPKEVLHRKAFPISVKEIFRAYVLQLAVQDGADGVIKRLFDNRFPPADFSGKGSNAFAISRKKTTSDEVFLAINSHQPLEGPAAWYEAHLVSDEGWNMMGGLFPGGPVVFHGTNENLGWAHTVNYIDKVDIFQLEMNPNDKYKYKFDNDWLELERRKVKLKVKIFLGLKIGVKKEALYSIHGPVIKNDTGHFAFKMAVFDEIRAVEQWYKMNKASNLKEFKEALKMTAIPSFNIVYADREDNLFYVGNGKIPFRNPNYNWWKTLPGNTSATLTTDYHPFSDLPQLTNPASGYLFNTNNSAFSATGKEDNNKVEDYDSTMGYQEFENNRSYRFMQLIDKYNKLSWKDFLDIKYDSGFPDSLVYSVNLNPIFDPEIVLEDSAAVVLDIIRSWDRMAESDRIGPAHVFLTYIHLRWNKDVSDKKDIGAKELEPSLKYAYRYLMKYFGTLNVTLGQYQKLVRGEKALPLRGLPDVISAMSSANYKDGMIKGRLGESYIMMVRYPKDGLPIIETVNVYGASNKPGSPHYDDQMELFVNKQLRPMTLDIEQVRKNAKRIYNPK